MKESVAPATSADEGGTPNHTMALMPVNHSFHPMTLPGRR